MCVDGISKVCEVKADDGLVYNTIYVCRVWTGSAVCVYNMSVYTIIITVITMLFNAVNKHSIIYNLILT